MIDGQLWALAKGEQIGALVVVEDVPTIGGSVYASQKVNLVCELGHHRVVTYGTVARWENSEEAKEGQHPARCLTCPEPRKLRELKRKAREWERDTLQRLCGNRGAQ
jgi:hypothetical protein